MRGRALSFFTGEPGGPRAAALPVGCALGAATICWYLGADVWHALALAAAIAVIGFALAAMGARGDVRDLRWPAEEPTGRKGSRNDVATLSWSLRAGWGSVGRTSEIRLQQLARRRLLIDGLELENPEHRSMIEGRLGAPVYAVLTRSTPRGLQVRTVTACLDALDALHPGAYPAPQPRSRAWAPPLISPRHRRNP